MVARAWTDAAYKQRLLTDAMTDIGGVATAVVPSLYTQQLGDVTYIEESRYKTVNWDYSIFYTGPLNALQLVIKLNSDEATTAEVLKTRGYATAITPGALHRGRLVHVQYKPLYEAIGEPNNRNRKPACVSPSVPPRGWPTRCGHSSPVTCKNATGQRGEYGSPSRRSQDRFAGGRVHSDTATSTRKPSGIVTNPGWLNGTMAVSTGKP